MTYLTDIDLSDKSEFELNLLHISLRELYTELEKVGGNSAFDFFGYPCKPSTVTVGTNPREAAYCPTSDRMFVTNYGSNSVSVLSSYK